VPKRIVITGASGNVGTALLRRLAEDGTDYEIVGVTRRRPPPDGVYRSVQWHQLDLADAGVEIQLLNIFRGAQCVIHLAWGFQPARNARYLDAVAINGSSAVLCAAHNAQVPHLVHMSSAGTYAPGRYGERVDESWSTAGIRTSAYSRAKSAAEKMLDGYEQRNPDGVGITRMRPGFVGQRDAAMGLRRYTRSPSGRCRKRAASPGAPQQVTQRPIEVRLAEPMRGGGEFGGRHSLARARQLAGALRAQ
jgi:nucleoside-diphosphate-sugar epimerase